MYPDSMFTFAEAAHKLGITVQEIFDLLDLDVETAKEENMTVDEIITACEEASEVSSSGSYYYSDWRDGCDSVANHCESYPYN